MFERYTESARRALFFSRYEASETGSPTIETEHLLLGLLRSRKGIVSRLLEGAAASVEAIAADIRKRIILREKFPTTVEIPFSKDTQRVLVLAEEEADRLGHGYIGTEHLLLGLLRAERSVAGSVLTAHRLRADPVRKNLVTLLNEHPQLAARVSEPSARSDTPSAAVDGIRTVLEHLRDNVAEKDNEARDLIDRICRDLETLKRRMS
jgi:ATP-dependent Clp protease ATP-binding subunit ClpC